MEIEDLGTYTQVTCVAGTAGLAQWSALLEQIVGLSSNVVLDARQIDSSLSEIESYLLALHADEMGGFRICRLAIVTADKPGCSAGYFARSGRNLGLRMASFDDPDQAISWVCA